MDDSGISILSPTNNGSWFEGLNLHEISLSLVPNGDCLFVRAFDVNGQLVDARMTTNIFESLTQYSATLEFVGHCCRRVDIQLIQTSGLVDLIPYGASGAMLDAHRLESDSSGEVVTVFLGPYREPVCRVEVIAPNDLTRILSICCVPAATNTCVNLPDFPAGTNTNPWTVEGVTFERIGGPGYNNVVPYDDMNVLELGVEMLITVPGGHEVRHGLCSPPCAVARQSAANQAATGSLLRIQS